MITLQLSEKQVQLVLTALAEQPMKFVVETFSEIQKQALSQQSGPPSPGVIVHASESQS